MNICKEARIAANLARLWPMLGREAGNRIAALYSINPSILTLARILAESERAS